MEILYISSVPSPAEFQHTKDTFRQGFIYGMNESGYKFHTLILNGLCSHPDVHIRSVVGRSVSMQTHSGLFWKKRVDKVSSALEYIHIGFMNVPVIKHLCIGAGYFFQTLKWLRQNRDKEKAIIMDAAYITAHPFVLAAAFGKCHISAIFCDIYEYMADVKDARNNEKVSFVRKTARSIARSSYNKLDSFILLTEQMNYAVNPGKKPYIVMEGLVDINMTTVPNELKDKAPFPVVMYAGALRAQYGLKNLVEGFQGYANPDARLWIFGAGDYAEDIQKAAETDNRIIFGGMIPLSEVVEKELRATLLVNARPIGMEFTQYSFPSKNMEYMVSGTPVLTTRLPGMPTDYYEHIFTIDGDSPHDVTVALEQVFSLSPSTLHKKGLGARAFVLDKKNNVIQAGRILSLIAKKEYLS